jgi:hypothetical protein
MDFPFFCRKRSGASRAVGIYFFLRFLIGAFFTERMNKGGAFRVPPGMWLADYAAMT